MKANIPIIWPFNLLNLIFIFFWPHWIFVAACGLSLVAVSRSTLRPQATGSKGSAVVARGL